MSNYENYRNEQRLTRAVKRAAKNIINQIPESNRQKLLVNENAIDEAEEIIKRAKQQSTVIVLDIFKI
jgi:23S rRNA pseudoU1915 N3-methylase RlmH